MAYMAFGWDKIQLNTRQKKQAADEEEVRGDGRRKTKDTQHKFSGFK